MGHSKKNIRTFQLNPIHSADGQSEQLSMRQFFFSVDTSLRLTSLDLKLGNLLASKISDALGTPYYEVLPRIGHNGEDSIEEAIRSGETKICRGFRFNCFYGGADADICIETKKDEAANVTGAFVTVRLYPFCEHFKEVERCRHFAAAGKNSNMLSHSIRNPLHTIKGTLFYLQQKYGDQAEVPDLTNLAFDEIAKIDNLVTRLLGDSGTELTPREADINAVLKEIEPFIALQANASNVDFMTMYGEVPPVLVDPFYIEQALCNVLRNALEAMPQGGNLIVETSSGEDSGRKCALVKVVDTGCGMSRKQIQSLLSEKKHDRGRGNGLQITLDIFRRHDGHVAIMSQKGVGTTVRLSVPGITKEG